MPRHRRSERNEGADHDFGPGDPHGGGDRTSPDPGSPGSSSQLVTALAAAVLQDLTARTGRHPRPKTVLFRPFSDVGLIRALHVRVSRNGGGAGANIGATAPVQSKWDALTLAVENKPTINATSTPRRAQPCPGALGAGYPHSPALSGALMSRRPRRRIPHSTTSRRAVGGGTGRLAGFRKSRRVDLARAEQRARR